MLFVGRCTAVGVTNRAPEGHNRDAGIVQICSVFITVQSCFSFFSCSSQLSSQGIIIQSISTYGQNSSSACWYDHYHTQQKQGRRKLHYRSQSYGAEGRKVKITCTLHNLSQCVKQKISFLSPHRFSNKYSQHKHNHLHLPTCFLCTTSCAHELPHDLGAAAKKDIRDCTCNITVKGGNKQYSTIWHRTEDAASKSNWKPLITQCHSSLTLPEMERRLMGNLELQIQATDANIQCILSLRECDIHKDVTQNQDDQKMKVTSAGNTCSKTRLAFQVHPHFYPSKPLLQNTASVTILSSFFKHMPVCILLPHHPSPCHTTAQPCDSSVTARSNY